VMGALDFENYWVTLFWAQSCKELSMRAIMPKADRATASASEAVRDAA